MAKQFFGSAGSHSLGDSRMFTLLLVNVTFLRTMHLTLLVCLLFHDKKSDKWIFYVILLSPSDLALAIFIFEYKNILNAYLTPPNGKFQKLNPFRIIGFYFLIGERSFSR